ncbi:MAG: signal recognition particle-docking protein FtsY [Proteocatella sp.]
MFKKLFGWGKKKQEEVVEAPEDLELESNVEEQSSEVEAEVELEKEAQEEAEPEVEVEIAETQESAEPEHDAEETFEIIEETISENSEEMLEAPVEEEFTESADAETAEVVFEEETDISEEESDIPEEELDIAEEEAEFEEAFEEAFEEEEVEVQPKGFFARLKEGLAKTTQNFTTKLDNLFKGYKTIDEEIYEELEEILITADVGFETTLKITEELRKRERENKIEDPALLQEELENIIEDMLLSPYQNDEIEETEKPKQKIMVVVGVNGVGKTTSIGKIASQIKGEGKTVMLAAADTFRAAAADQLTIWAQRAGVPIVKHQEGADPSAVIFDAIKSAKAQNTDVLICDTAGRLHNKKNLMSELEKIFKIINREFPDAEKEVLLVIDATTGQNAITQAKVFKEAAPLNGLILTKLDGTAKGGVVLGIISELSIPIKYVGVGEKIADLQKFDAQSFAKALFGKNI